MAFLCHGQSVFICVNPWQKLHRAGGIRTHDLLNPIQAFYQAELRPDLVQTIHQLLINRQGRAMKAIIRRNAYVHSWLVVILIGGVCATSAQPPNGIALNEMALSFAAGLINKGQVVADNKGGWTKHRPSTDEENEFIRLHGLAEYAKWHLGVDLRFAENSKRRYKFPYGDFKNVHRCGLLAAKARARQYRYADIENAAAELEHAIKKRTD
jgi:hypothetical protein